ncbi:ATP-binding protein [Dactylosporangium sp. CA-233914]|uniref:ATP-binding protein n=1 Tax=Dactylosporangium sp. CA-233914 TaxID=3239934 RepID=UPI003D929DA0
MTTEELIFTAEPDFPVSTLRVAGRLTFTSVADLRQAAGKALTDHPEVLLLDVAGLSVVDDITLTSLPMLARQGVATETDVMVVGPDAVLLEQLERLGIARQVPVHADAGAALAAHARLPGPRRLEAFLAPEPDATSAARGLVDRACAQWHVAHVADAAALIVTELVANAVEHAGTPLLVSVALRSRHLHLGVRDDSPLPLIRAVEDRDGEPGRGLLIVEGMATAWGCVHTAGGKVVWATLRLGREG